MLVASPEEKSLGKANHYYFMWTTLTLLIFLGFYLNYVTSAKTRQSLPPLIQDYTNKYRVGLRRIGMVLLFLALIISTQQLGWGSGVFIFTILLMTVASLIILLAPLELLQPIPLFLGLSMLIITENLLL